MIELNGKYDNAIIYNDEVEETALSQINTMINSSFSQKAHTRVMPDVHAGKGAVIGYTAYMGDKIVPNIVGVDIGCGVLALHLGKVDIDFEKLDNVIRNNIPHGKNVHSSPVVEKYPEGLKEISDKTGQDFNRVLCSIGTLGGGNHFIEVGENPDGEKYLFIHSGSRNFGLKIAQYHQDKAKNNYLGDGYEEKKNEIISKYKNDSFKKHLINDELRKLKNHYSNLQTNGLEYLEGEAKDEYLYDMQIAQKYASLNRDVIASIILVEMEMNSYEVIESTHNYINFEDNIIRKGAISAHKGERIVIPMNMRFGHVIGIGKGNPDFNYSAPHGAGRKMSRGKAKKNITLEDFQKVMEGVYSTSVKNSTIDEAPQAYKRPEEVIEYMSDSVEVETIVPPIYNFKAD